jgi:hypothetical protein
MDRNNEALRDVRRKISEVMNKEEGKIVFGYRPKEQTRKEGDVWTDARGREWTVKNGIPQNVTKLDGAKIPLWCPQCSRVMKHKLDNKFYRRTGACMDCMFEKETELKRLGKWEEYSNEILKKNYIDYIKDKIQELQDYYDNVSAPEFIHADNEKILMVERWGIDIDSVKADLMRDMDILKDHLARVEQGVGT